MSVPTGSLDDCIRVGPAGWIYADWKGIVYPKPAPKGFDPLVYLAHYFDTIEINSSFYRPPRPETVRTWVERVRPHERFLFTGKLWRRFTHEREQLFTQAEVAEAGDPFKVLHDAGKLGAVLLQFPWSFRRTDANASGSTTSYGPEVFPLVVEIRHESRNVPDFYTELAERRIGFVNIDQPLFKQSIKPSTIATAPVGYVRVHGRNYRDWFRKDAGPAARYDYLYSAEELKPWVKRVEEVAKSTRETYVVTNNHYLGKGPTNALMFRSMLTKAKVPGPPDLFHTFATELESYAEPVSPPSGANSSQASRTSR
jgi:uncharacterized protein YecE (DUF72 family)